MSGAMQERWLLVSDVDDTLTGDDAALAALGETLRQHRGGIVVALNSSRPAQSIARTLDRDFPSGFPVDAVISALGTEMALGGVMVSTWSDQFLGWPRDRIAQAVGSLGYTPHDAEFQTPWKASFAVPADAWNDVTAALAAENLPCRIITSGQSDLDIIPPTAGKDAAALFLASHLGIARSRLVVAGDSGNDLALFSVAARAIAVGNARRELLAAMPIDVSYHASLHHAAGVGEGLAHFGLLTG
jgi:sucrose-6F-phosphate phosphohydrolase